MFGKFISRFNFFLRERNSHIKNPLKRTKKRFAKTVLSVFLLFVIVLSNIAPVFGQSVVGRSQEYLDLFGTNPTPSDDDIKAGKESGVAYFKPTDTSVKEIIFAISLKFLNQQKGEGVGEWSKVASHFEQYNGLFSDNCIAGTGPEFRFLNDDSFVLRYYPVDINGNPDLSKVSYVNVPKSSCLTEKNIDQITKNGDVSKEVYKYLPTSGILNRAGHFIGAADDSSGVNVITAQTLSINIRNSDSAGSKLGADLWYCSGLEYQKTLVVVDLDKELKGNNKRVQKFPDKCIVQPSAEDVGDVPYPPKIQGSYVQIGKSITFTIPNSAEAQEQINDTANKITSQLVSNDDGLPKCGIINENESLLGCVAQIIYGLIYKPLAWIVALFGNLFDFFLGYSVSDESYRFPFVVTGWKLVRDISNIFFIIILVYTGFATVFGAAKTSMKSVVANVIFNAILINFSLFATRAVIDLSNVTARIFYNQMHVCKIEDTDENGCINPKTGQPEYKRGAGRYWPLSEAVLSSFNPQRLFKAETIDPNQNIPKEGSGSKFTDSIAPRRSTANEAAGYYIVVTLISSAIIISIGMMFWKVAFMFLGRIIGLYVAMIFAPFAFLSRGDMPLVGKIKDLSWNKWVNDLSNYAVLAPIFVFFLYIIFTFMQSGFGNVFTAINKNSTFFENVLSITIPLLIVFFLLKKGEEIAKKYAGDIGNMAQEWGQKATGAALGIATGGAAFLGRNAIGRGLGAVGKLKTGKTFIDDSGKEVQETYAARWAANANNSWMGRKWNNTFSATQTGSWDARNIGVKVGGKEYTAGGTIMKGLGLKDNVSGILGIGKDKALGKDGKPGGNVMINKKRDERKQKELENKIQMSHLSDDDAKIAGLKYKEDRIKKYGEDHWEEGVDDIKVLKVHKDKIAAAETQLEEANKTGGVTLADKLRISRAETALETAKSEFGGAKLAVIQNIKDGKDSTSKAEAQSIAAKEEVDRLRNYGKIKDNKSFTNMMRAEYVQDLQNSSFWGEFTKSGIGSAFGKTVVGSILGTLLPALAPATGAILGGIFANELTTDLIDKATGSRSRAIKAIIKKAKATPGTGNTLVDLEDKLQKHKDEALKAVNEALGKSYASYEDIPLTDVEEGVLRKIATLEEEVERFDHLAKSAATPKEKADARYMKAKAKRDLDNLKKLDERMAQAQKNLDEYKDRQKDKEEREKEKKEAKSKAKDDGK